MDVVGFLRENWSVIAQAPWAFALCAVLFLGIGFAIASQITASAHSVKDERLALAESRVADYKEKLDGKSPQEAASKIEALEGRLAALEPRRLPPDVVDMLRLRLSAQPANVLIARDIASGDVGTIFQQLMTLFRSANWTVEESAIIIAAERPPSGITLYSNSKGTRPSAIRIRDALTAAGVSHDFVERTDPLTRLPAFVLTSPSHAS